MSITKQIERAFKETNLVFLTGPGGTGKTYNINEYCKDHRGVARTATTGVSATHISGETIHRFSGIGPYKDEDSFYRITNSDFFHEISARINQSNLIIIDEVSMLHRKQFDLISRVFAYACYNRKPFGGKKILFSGDFLQLPPVNKEGDPKPWVFESEFWQNTKIIELTKIMRQSDVDFTKTLMNIRRGLCTDSDNEMISSREGFSQIHKDVKPVKFVATNKEADQINNYELNKIKGNLYESIASLEIFNAKSEKHKSMLESQIISDMIAPLELQLKIGAQVMILANGGNYCNGTMGEVVKIKDGIVEVNKFEGGKAFIEKYTWKKLDQKDNEVAIFRQYPLKLAYAITVHKSQGMTLDFADIDFKNFFAPGQAYVALSRVKSLDGLTVRNWNKDCVKADKNALDFYGLYNNE